MASSRIDARAYLAVVPAAFHMGDRRRLIRVNGPRCVRRWRLLGLRLGVVAALATECALELASGVVANVALRLRLPALDDVTGERVGEVPRNSPRAVDRLLAQRVFLERVGERVGLLK